MNCGIKGITKTESRKRETGASLAGFGGHKVYKYGGHPAPAGRALPNLLMRSECLKSTCLFGVNQNRIDFDFDFKILTA